MEIAINDIISPIYGGKPAAGNENIKQTIDEAYRINRNFDVGLSTSSSASKSSFKHVVNIIIPEV
jgi:hypothetical protein